MKNYPGLLECTTIVTEPHGESLGVTLIGEPQIYTKGVHPDTLKVSCDCECVQYTKLVLISF